MRTMLVAALAVLLAAPGAAGARDLVLGLRVPRLVAGSGQFRCVDIPPLPADMDTPRKYLPGASQDKLDLSAAGMASQADHARVEGYVKSINDLAAQFVRGGETPPGDTRVRACLLRNLTQSARAQALLGRLSPQAFDTRMFATPALALDYDLAAAAGPIDAGTSREIVGWLQALERPARGKVAGLWQAGLGPGRGVNNHLYWAGYSALLVGIAAQDRAAFGWGRDAILRGLDSIDQGGFQAAELSRGSRALSYSAFALQPLTAGVLILDANAGGPNNMQRAALARACDRTARGVMDPEAFRRDAQAIGFGLEPQVGVPKAPPFVRIAPRIFRPSAAVERLNGNVAHTASGWLGPSFDDVLR